MLKRKSYGGSTPPQHGEQFVSLQQVDERSWELFVTKKTHVGLNTSAARNVPHLRAFLPQLGREPGLVSPPSRRSSGA
jgi:hypothetical protein